MMLHASGIPYTENFVPRGDSWLKARGLGSYPFDQLPVVHFVGDPLDALSPSALAVCYALDRAWQHVW